MTRKCLFEPILVYNTDGADVRTTYGRYFLLSVATGKPEKLNSNISYFSRTNFFERMGSAHIFFDYALDIYALAEL